VFALLGLSVAYIERYSLSELGAAPMLFAPKLNRFMSVFFNTTLLLTLTANICTNDECIDVGVVKCYFIINIDLLTLTLKT